MWIFRRMLKISWTERMKNEEVLRRVGTARVIMEMIRRRQFRFHGHTMRLQQLESVTGKVKGRRGRGRPRVKLVDSLVKVAGGGITPAQLLQRTESRSNWCFMVASVLEDTPCGKISTNYDWN